MAREHKPAEAGQAKAEQEKRTRQAGAEKADAEPGIDVVHRAHAVAARSGGMRPQGKGRDARSMREGAGANVRRGNKPPPDSDKEEEDEEEKKEEEDLFWKSLVDGAYRSRKRRGEWIDPQNLG
jgi:hypothetical protein